MRDDELLERGADLIDFYRANPAIAAFDLLKVDLSVAQRVVLKSMWDSDYVIIVFCG